MALILDGLSLLLVTTGVFFFIVGTIGLVRFPDLFTALHALSKADNIGLGMVVMGLMLGASSMGEVVKLLLIWILAMFAASTTSHLIARKALRTGVEPWQR